MNPATIELNIEELVLHGFSPHDAFRIGQAVERELSRLFRERGFVPDLQGAAALQISSLDLGTFNLAENAPAGAIGNGLSKALFRGFRSEFSPQQDSSFIIHHSSLNE